MERNTVSGGGNSGAKALWHNELDAFGKLNKDGIVIQMGQKIQAVAIHCSALWVSESSSLP